jgi:hypothetical protein
LLIPGIFFLASNSLQAQEKFGLSISNFGGINAVHLNPTATSNSKVFFDFNLATAGFSADNNFVYVHKEDFSFADLLIGEPVFPDASTRGEGFDYRTDKALVNGFVKADVTGPSLSISLGSHSFGLFSRAVSTTSATRFPYEIGVFLFEGIEYEPLQNVPIQHSNFTSASMAYAEVGLNYAYRFVSNKYNYWSAGINLRRLIGYGGLYINAVDAGYTILNDTTIDIRNMHVETGFSLPMDYDDSGFPGPDPVFKGSGLAADIGVTYRRHRNMKLIPPPGRYCEWNYQPYLYKIGLSLLDLGSITFNQNAQEHAFENVSAYWPGFDSTEFQSVNNLAGQFSDLFYGDPDASFVQSNNLRIGTSAAVSMQADVQYYPDWYLAGAVILPLKIGKYQIERPSQAYLSLRYETDIFEINIPVSLYDFEKPRMGFYVRYRYLSLGSDNLVGFLGVDDQYGLDIYASLKYHFVKGFCRRTRPFRDCRHLAF